MTGTNTATLNTQGFTLPFMSATSRPRPPRVLLAMYAAGDPRAALQRAYAFAQALGGELMVLSVLPEIKSRSPQRNPAGVMRALGMRRTALLFTRRLCDQALPVRLHSDSILVQQGSFLQTVASVAAEYKASLIVLPPAEGQRGQRVTKLARLSRVPVLIARAPGATKTIIAASDLQDKQHPVLRRANRISLRLAAPVVFVHNVPPAVNLEGSELFNQRALKVQRQLKRASERLSSRAETVVSLSLSTVEAILSVARQERADLIVIGAHRQRWSERFSATGVAAQVAERSTRSVLVDPLQ